nr:MAG TPA: hypothetical protein [Caudoviricetes sp.]
MPSCQVVYVYCVALQALRLYCIVIPPLGELQYNTTSDQTRIQKNTI